MPDAVFVTTALAFVIGMLIFFFAHGFWWERKEKKYARLRQETATWLDTNDREDFVAVHGTEWRWAVEGKAGFHWIVTPWPKKPWVGTEWEAQQEDTYG